MHEIMEKIKFIATDMDGTLLNKNKALPNNFFYVLEQLQMAGVLFAAASGRQFYSLEHTLAPVKDKIIFIGDNGTMVMYKGKELYSITIPREEAQQFIRAARQIPNSYLVLVGKKSAYIETQDPIALTEIPHYYHRLETVPDLLAVEDDIIKVSVLHLGKVAEHVYPQLAYFKGSHQIVMGSEIWLDFMHKDASKGAAIKKLQQIFNFSYEQSMSFGDYLNDIEMLEQTYYSYAMENAHPEVKAVARFIAPSNEEAGVLQVIKAKVL